MSIIEIPVMDFYDIIDELVENEYCPCGYNAETGCPFTDDAGEVLECGMCWEKWFMQMGASEKE